MAICVFDPADAVFGGKVAVFVALWIATGWRVWSAKDEPPLFILLEHSEHRPLKNQQSIRRIPLIGEITRLGFLRYRAAIKALGYKLLFPKLKANSDRTPLGDAFHGDWIKV